MKKQKSENNWKTKTLESLEKDFWNDPGNDSYLITTCYKLRKKPLVDFETEDLRIMIEQNSGIKFLMPLAIEVLENNILAEGHFYEGDLLKAVLTSDLRYWKAEKDNWKHVCNLFNTNKELLHSFQTTSEIRNSLLNAFQDFKKIN